MMKERMRHPRWDDPREREEWMTRAFRAQRKASGYRTKYKAKPVALLCDRTIQNGVMWCTSHNRPIKECDS